MDNKKIGNFIADLRKEKGLTQKALADILGVTDKAVSKWECGAGYPEITLVPTLAQTLDVSMSELLSGERHTTLENEPPVLSLEKTDTLVTETIALAEHSHEEKKASVLRIAFICLIFSFIISSFVCMLCDFILSRSFSWSLIVVGGDIVAFLMSAPFFLMKRHRFAASLGGLTVSILPYLFLIERLTGSENWVLPLALPITVLSLVCLWVILILFAYTKINRFYLTGFIFLLFGIFLSLTINGIVDRYTHQLRDPLETVVNTLSSLFIAVLLFAYGYFRKSKKLTRKEKA